MIHRHILLTLCDDIHPLVLASVPNHHVSHGEGEAHLDVGTRHHPHEQADRVVHLTHAFQKGEQQTMYVYGAP